MGDRGNIVIVQEATKTSVDQVWLYSHWGGTELPAALQQAINRGKERWDDPAYFTRIVFDSMMDKDSHGEETGFGVTVRMTDNEHKILVCDVPKKRIYTVPEKDLQDRQVAPRYKPTGETWSFEDYGNLVSLPTI